MPPMLAGGEPAGVLCKMCALNRRRTELVRLVTDPYFVACPVCDGGTR